jgi:hypothetical protein
VAGIGSDVLPTLVEIAKDKKGNYPKHLRQRAVETIGFMKAEAKFAVPELIAFLKETNHIEIRDAAVDALNHIGPPAKEAIPELIEMLDISLRDVDKKAVLSTAQREFSKFESSLIGSLCSIDRNIPEIMQDLRIDWVSGDPEVQVRVVVRGTQQQWRNAVESLKKKYPTPK